MSFTTTDAADYIWREETGSSNSTSIPEIAYYIKSAGIGKLNTLIFTSYTINDAQEIEPELGHEELAILGAIYKVKFYTTMNMNVIGAAGVTSEVLEYSSDGTTIRKQSRGVLSQQWSILKKDAQNELLNLISSYKILKAVPRDISGIEILQIVDSPARFNRIIQ